MNETAPSPIPAIRVLIVVDSWEGHTARVAERFAEGVREAGGLPVTVTADAATRADLQSADALVMGSAVHQRGMTWKMKRFVDEVCEPVWFYDELVGRVGAVFTAGGGAGGAGGGAESAQLGMLANLAALGMVLVTLPKDTPGSEHGGIHWGPTIKTTTEAMQPIAAADLPAAAMLAYFHHGSNVVRVAQRLRGLTLAAANHMPTPEVRKMRADSEKGTRPDQRLPHPADPTGQAR
jgi:NAD(P)H dehydrogenase (quinone)